jgi:hypothetical protein
VRVIGNNAAIETGSVRFKGTDKDGKTVRRQRTLHDDLGLARRTLQVAADHTSEIKP